MAREWAGDGGSDSEMDARRSLWRDPQIASLLVAVAISFLGFGLVSPLRTLYARAEGAGGGEVGLMSAAFFFSSFVFLFPFGWLADRYSRVGIIVCGLLAHGLISVAYVWATSGELFILLRFVEGATSAAVLPSARALLADLVPRGRNGEAFGLMSAGMIFGLLGGPPVGSFLADGLGYAVAYAVAAGMFLPATALVLVAFRHYSPPQHNRTDAAGDRGGWRSIFTLPMIAGLLVRFAIGIGPGLATAVWSIYLADLGFSLPLIGWTYIVYAVPIMLVAPGAGRLSDRFGRLGMMFGAGVMLSVMFIAYGLVSAFALFMVLGILEGSFDAVARSANDGYLADHSPPDSRGRAQSVFNGVQQLGGLVAAVAGGFLYEINHSLPFVASGGLMLVLMLSAAAIAIIAARRAPKVSLP